LGAGEAGKSTTFKQLVQLFGPGFPPEVRRTFPSVIFSNTISSMKLLLERIPAGVELAADSIPSQTHINDLKVAIH
jgi:guanine nucleotide-binding protein G(i) subunit alpha